MRNTKKPIGFIFAVLCYSITIAGAFYLIGYKAAYDRMEHSASTLIPQTFYAAISDIQDNMLTVKGMELNDMKTTNLEPGPQPVSITMK